MKTDHLVIVMDDGRTSYYHKAGNGSDPAPDILEHTKNMTKFVIMFNPKTIEIINNLEEE